MSKTTLTVTVVTALVGAWVGYTMAGVGGALLWAALWGFGGFFIGRAILSTAHLLWRLGNVGVAIVLFALAIVLTWGVRF